MEPIPVQGHEDLVRDPKSNAIVMADPTRYQEFMETYNRAKQKKTDEQAQLEQRFQKIENGMEEIKTMFGQLLEAINAKS